MKRMKHWQDPVNAVLGAWLVLSPWVLGFPGETTAAANAVIIGAALVAAAVGAIVFPKPWEEWTEAALGLWMIASPWVLGYTALQSATAGAFLVGMLVCGFALWVLLTDKDWGWLRDGAVS